MARRWWRQGGAIAVLIGYLGLTLAFTWPLATAFTRAIPGDGFDGWQNYWNLWWMKVALLEKHTWPFFTDLLYHPTGVGLLFHTLNPFNGLFTLPIQVAFGLFPAYNSVVLFSFVLAGLGAYLLAREMLGPGSSRVAAFAAGAIFTFAPVHIAHLLGHMQVISLEWIPFFVLYLLRATDGHRGKKKRRNLLLAAFFLVLVALCDWYYVLYVLIFSAVVAVWKLLTTRPLRRVAGDLAVIAGIWMLWATALSPLLWPMIREATQYRFMVPDPAQSRLLSADLLAFVTPHGFHPVWGAWAREQSKVFTSSISEYTVFAGYVTLALVVVAVWPQRGKGARCHVARITQNSKTFWLLVLAVFFVLALGPVLHIAGRTALLPGGGEIPLPYGWLVRLVPFMEITRSVSRYDVMVMLALGLLAAWGVDRLWRGGRRTQMLAVIACAGLLFEFLPAPYPISPPDTPAWYEKLATDARSGAVLNLPMNWDRPGYLLYQTVHRKPLTAAYISREDPRTLVERAPVLQHFRHLGPDIIAFDLRRQGLQVLADLGVRWVVLDRYKMPGGAEREVTEALAAAIFGDWPPLYADERLTVYEVVPPAQVAPYLILASGWEPFDKERRVRAFTDHADVVVRAPAAGSATLRVVLAAGSAAIDAEPSGDVFIVPLALQPGDNVITLRSRQGGQRVVVREIGNVTFAIMPARQGLKPPGYDVEAP